MLSTKSIEAIAKASGLSVDALTDAINKEDEVNVEVTTSKHFTSKEWETFEQSIDNEKKAKYDEGKGVGQKQLIKDLKEKEGLEYEGRDSEKFLEKFKEKVLSDADKNPDEKVVALQNDIKVLREQTIPDLETQVAKERSSLQAFKTKSIISNHIPDNLPSGFTKNDALLIIQNNLEFGVDEDGKQFVKKNGEVLKNDKTRENLSYEQVVGDFVKERGWVKGTPGKDGGDEGGEGGVFDISKVRKMSELEEYFEENNINPKSEKASALIAKADKHAREAKEEFDYMG